jgi:hypothetical protein
MVLRSLSLSSCCLSPPFGFVHNEVVVCGVNLRFLVGRPLASSTSSWVVAVAHDWGVKGVGSLSRCLVFVLSSALIAQFSGFPTAGYFRFDLRHGSLT